MNSEMTKNQIILKYPKLLIGQVDSIKFLYLMSNGSSSKVMI